MQAPRATDTRLPLASLRSRGGALPKGQLRLFDISASSGADGKLHDALLPFHF